MDLRLKSRWEMVCGASAGLGLACSEVLASEGVKLVMVARDPVRLKTSADNIQANYPVEIITHSANISHPKERDQLLQNFSNLDILITNSGGPPIADFMSIATEQWLDALSLNMLAPIALIRGVIDGMVKRKFGRIVNITSVSVKSPRSTMCLSTGARAGLTGAISALARDIAKHNVTINNLLPGPFITERLKKNNELRSQYENVPISDIEKDIISHIPARRFGDPYEFACASAFLCSIHAGFITGQNLVIDGGSFRGLL